MTIKAFDPSGSPVVNASVQLAAASAVTGIMNGSSTSLTSAGDWYPADREGVVNLIVPTIGLGFQSITIGGIQDCAGTPLQVDKVVLDLTKNAMGKLGTKLDSFKSFADLKGASTQNGSCCLTKEICHPTTTLRQDSIV